MAASFLSSVSNNRLPRWAILAVSAVGLLLLGMGVGRLLRLKSLSEAVAPMLIGSLAVYLSGFEKELRVGDEGVYHRRAFWGRGVEKKVGWDEVESARLILNKGNNIYLLLRSAEKIPPFTFRRNDEEGIPALLNEKLPDGKVSVER